MARSIDPTGELHRLVGQRIEYGFEFVREILDDPSILDHIPSGSTIESIPG